MIVELVIGTLLDFLAAMLAAIPDASIPAIASTALEDFAQQIGGTLGGLDNLLPISEVGIFIGWVLGTYAPIVLSYQAAMWVWTHLPIIGNGA